MLEKVDIKEEGKTSCIVFSIAEIEYDNPILNNVGIIGHAIKKYSFCDILDLSIKVDRNLIDTAITNDDQELLLAGLMSVDNTDIVL